MRPFGGRFWQTTDRARIQVVGDTVGPAEYSTYLIGLNECGLVDTGNAPSKGNFLTLPYE